MTTIKARSALRAVAFEDPDPSRVLETVNGYLMRELPPESFVTAVFGTIATESGHVRLAVAGHPEPVICGRPDAVLPSELRAPPLGVVPQLGAGTWELDLRKDEVIALVTDGVLEAGRTDAQFGSERLCDLLHGIACGGTAEETVESILSGLDEHTGAQLDDDVAIVALQWTS